MEFISIFGNAFMKIVHQNVGDYENSKKKKALSSFSTLI